MAVFIALWASALNAVAAEKTLTIGVSTLGLRFPFAAALSRGEHKAAAEAGVKVMELDANVDLLKQASDIDRLVAAKVDGIVVVPMDSTAAEGWADKAKAAGIPMVADAVWVGNTDEHEVDEPTAGIDVGAKEDVWRAVRALAATGKAALVVLGDFEELLAVCDRLLVVRAGRVVAERRASDTSEHELLALASGLAR